MTISNISSTGRFSSQMLTYFGVQKNVKVIEDSTVNTFKYQLGPTSFISPDTLSQSTLGYGVVGSFKSAYFDSIKCYFLSRNSSVVHAETMAALVIDASTILNTTPQQLLREAQFTSKLNFKNNSYKALNILRDTGNQIGSATTPSNRNSLQARQIRA